MNIEICGHYYYRENNYVPVRITVIEKGKAGFYKCVKGHWTPSELHEKRLEPFLIHVNRITF